MLHKRLENITEADLQALIDNEIPESKLIEYKRDLPGETREDKKEFLADVSSFANTAGGDLIFGIDEGRDGKNDDAGSPMSIVGVDADDRDRIESRLSNIIRDGLAPRIRHDLRWIDRADQNPVLIIRIAQSWQKPHMVISRKTSAFFERHGNGKYPLEVQEIRTAFLLSDSINDRIRGFVAERNKTILGPQPPVARLGDQQMILHLCPIQSFSLNYTAPMGLATGFDRALSPIGQTDGTATHNFEGILVSHRTRQGLLWADDYVQLHRNGCIEAVNSSLFPESRHDINKSIPVGQIEQALIGALRQYLGFYKELVEIIPPIVGFFSIMGTSDCGITDCTDFFVLKRLHSIKNSDLIFPPLMIDSLEPNVKELLEPTFDMLWQAFGAPRRLKY